MLKRNLKDVAEELIAKGEDFTAYDVSRTMNDRLVANQEFPIRHLMIRDIVHEVLNEFVNNGELDKCSGMHKGNYCLIYSPVATQLMKDAAKTCGIPLSDIFKKADGKITDIVWGPDVEPKLNKGKYKTVVVNRTKYGVNIPASLSKYAGFVRGRAVGLVGNSVQNYGYSLIMNRTYTVDKHNEVRLTNAALIDMKIQSAKVKLTASRTGCIKVEEA